MREYLQLYGRLYGIADPNPQIDAGLERFRIPHLADAMGTELSSGQRTLVGIVRATLHRPRLLVLDEPTASLDPDVAARVRTGLKELSDEDGCSLLITSHDMGEVERVCDRVVFLSHGRIVADGTPDEIAQHYGHGDLEGVFLQLAERHELNLAADGPSPDAHTSKRSSPSRRPALAWLRMRAIARRHAYVMVRSPHRLFDVSLWPLVDVLLFGSLGAYVGTTAGDRLATRRRVPHRRASSSGTSSTSRRSP